MWSVLKKRISRLHALLTRSINGLVGHLLRSRWPEIALLGVVSIAYGFGVLNPDPTLVLPGREIQAHVGFMELFNHWLRGETSFPLWNPIPGYGRSLIADPFLFVFNPFMSVPVAALGVVSGPKVAVLLHLFIAGLGCWAIARVLDLGRPARLWCGLLYMMSGAFPAYLSAGQFQLALSLSWLPWSIAGWLWALRDPGAISVACAAAAQALFFFSGNLYHQFYGGITLLLIGLACIIDWQRRKLRMRRLRSFAGVALLSLGLIAVQLLPMATSISSMHNEGGYQREDRNFPGSQRPEHAILNYLVSDPWFYLDPTLDKIPYLQESYRFIGIAPFLLLLFLVPAYRQGHRREIAAFAASFAILVGWASLRYSPVRYLYDAAPFLYQLRFPGRALSVGALSLILLAGFGLNYLWGSTDQLRQSGQRHDLAGRSTAVLIAKALVVAGIVGGIYRAFEVNRELFFLEPIQPLEVEVAVEWLLEQGPEEPAVLAQDGITRSMVLDAYRNGIRLLGYIDGWRAAPAPHLIGEYDALQVSPPIIMDWRPIPLDTKGYSLVYRFRELQIWRNPNEFPAAFLLPARRLSDPTPVTADEVIPLAPVGGSGINARVLEVEANERSLAVVTESWFEGWTATVDGQPADLVSVSNYLAVRVPPGQHSIRFEYTPWSFPIGLAISGISWLLVAAIGAKSLLGRRTFRASAWRAA